MGRVVLKWAVALALVFGLGGGLDGGAARAALFNAHQFTLDNGLRVVVLPDHRSPAVTQMMWYQVGSADEKRGKSGIAHFLEHLMFKGTEAFPKETFNNAVSYAGGVQNAFTTYDVTTFHQTVHKDQLRQVMAMEADRMNGLILAEEDVKTELEIILDERRYRIDNSPGGLLAEQRDALLFINHPYGTPPIGWRHEMELLTRTDALDWYKKYYHPNNAILILAGDISPENGRALAQEIYGPIPGSQLPERVRPTSPEPSAARSLEVVSSIVTSLRWSRVYLAPSAVEGEIRYAVPLEILAQLLGGGSNARLYTELVKKRKLASGVYASYDPLVRGLTDFQIVAVALPGVTPEQIGTAVDGILADLASKGPSQDELDRVKSGLVAGASFVRDDVAQAAQLIGHALSAGVSIADLEAWPEQVEKTDVNQVRDAAAYLFRPERSVTGLLRPPPPKPQSATKPGAKPARKS